MEWRWEVATRDRATGLPNAAIYRDRLAQALEHARRRQQPVCIMIATVKPSESFELAEAGARIEAVIRGSDTVARFGSSDLALILPGLGATRDVDGVITRIRLAAGASLVGIGYAVAPGDAADPESLLFVASRRRDDKAA